MNENIMSDYKQFSLNKFKEWVHDLLDGDLSVPEIHQALIDVIEEDIEYYSSKMSRAYELLSLVQKKELSYDNSQYSEETLNAMCDAAEAQEKKWVLPVELSYVDGEEDYLLSLPNDLLKSVDWKEGDTLEWIPQENNSYILKKVSHEE